MRSASGFVGPPCPVAIAAGEDHGPLLGAKDGQGWLCPDQRHDGRPKSHPEGPAPQTRFKFKTAEVDW